MSLFFHLWLKSVVQIPARQIGEGHKVSVLTLLERAEETPFLLI